MSEGDHGLPAELEELLPDFDAWVRGGRTPDDAAIAARRFQLSDAQCQQLKNEYLRRNQKFIDYTDPRVLRGNQRIASWYSGPDHPGAWCWPAYKTKLERWDDDDLAALDRASTKIMASLEHPSQTTFNRRGLVVGYVQSGKTANYSALVAKAADVGYRLFIVLSGVTESLRRQTQKRLRLDIVSSHPAHWETLTVEDHDFRGNASAAAAVVDLQSHRKRVLAVVKKNTRILGNLTGWLGENQNRDTLRDCPVLIIDDEADNASVNTNNPDTDPTRVNGCIRELLAVLPRVSFVGYTATPFANFFIDPRTPDDLFPRDFIFDLERPKAYFGAEKIFGRELLWNEGRETPELDGLDIVREIKTGSAGHTDERSMLVPAKAADRFDFEPELPPSLKDAIEYFFLATAARYARGDSRKHSTMLVHTTMYVDLHDATQDLLDGHLALFKENWNSRKKDLMSHWDDESGRASFLRRDETSFSEIWAQIPRVLERAQVIVDNGRRESNLTFTTEDEPDHNPVVMIAVGGNTFSRGLTLEGLVVSYYMRRAAAYDTLLQMGRWFGYRAGYEDLPRIWMTNELQEQFQFLASVEEEIRQDIRRLEREQLTPMDLAIRVRTHPKLMITASNKMGGSHLVSASFANRRLQSFLFNHKDAPWLNANIDSAKALGSAVRDTAKETEAGSGTWLASDVPVEEVLRFLRSYRFHEDHDDLRRDLLERYISAERRQGALERWDVAFVGLRKAEHGTIDLGLQRPLNCVNRSRFRDTEPCNIKALMTRKDRVIDLVDVDHESDDAAVTKSRNEQRPRVGLLVVYAISKSSVPEKNSKTEYRRCTTCRKTHHCPQGASAVRHPLDAVADMIGVGLVFPGSNTAEASFVANNLGDLLKWRDLEENEVAPEQEEP